MKLATFLPCVPEIVFVVSMSRGICKSLNLQIPRNEFANSVSHQLFTTRNMQIDEISNYPTYHNLKSTMYDFIPTMTLN